MNVKIKKLHESAKIPAYAKDGDAGMDLYATSVTTDKYDNEVCHTGLSMEIPEGYVGLIFPRSSISKTSLFLRNAVGVIDSGYRGEIILKFACFTPNNPEFSYSPGDRVGQIIILPYPKINFIEVDQLTETDRGSGGFGSTGE